MSFQQHYTLMTGHLQEASVRIDRIERMLSTIEALRLNSVAPQLMVLALATKAEVETHLRAALEHLRFIISEEPSFHGAVTLYVRSLNLRVRSLVSKLSIKVRAHESGAEHASVAP